MSIVEELAELERMVTAGTLTDEEFAAAKARLIGAAPGRDIAAEVDELHRRRELDGKLAELDRWWNERSEDLMLHGRYGPSIPTKGTAVAAAIIAVVGFIVMGLSLTVGPLEFVAFGVLLAVIGIFQTRAIRNRANQYEQAEAYYRTRRAEILNSATPLLKHPTGADSSPDATDGRKPYTPLHYLDD